MSEWVWCSFNPRREQPGGDWVLGLNRSGADVPAFWVLYPYHQSDRIFPWVITCNGHLWTTNSRQTLVWDLADQCSRVSNPCFRYYLPRYLYMLSEKLFFNLSLSTLASRFYCRLFEGELNTSRWWEGESRIQLNSPTYCLHGCCSGLDCVQGNQVWLIFL